MPSQRWLAAKEKEEADSSPLADKTLDEALTWIDENVTDLPSAKIAMKHMARLLFAMRRKLDV